MPFLPKGPFALEYQKHSVPQPDIFPLCVIFASVIFPALAVILSCVAIVVPVALSVVGCASEPVVPATENVVPVTKTNNTRTLDFVIRFIKEALLYKKLLRLPILKKDSSAALTTGIFGVDNVFNFCFSRHTMYLVTVGLDGKVHPTKYLEILTNAISDVSG